MKTNTRIDAMVPWAPDFYTKSPMFEPIRPLAERFSGFYEWPELEATFEQWRDEMAQDFAIGQSVHAFSDHFPFFMAGVPTGGIQSAERSLEGRGYGHTRYDTVDKVEQKALREASTLAARLAMRMASADPWPAARRDEAAVLQLLDSPDYREEQEFRDRLDAFYVQARQEKA